MANSLKVIGSVLHKQQLLYTILDGLQPFLPAVNGKESSKMQGGVRHDLAFHKTLDG